MTINMDVKDLSNMQTIAGLLREQESHKGHLMVPLQKQSIVRPIQRPMPFCRGLAKKEKILSHKKFWMTGWRVAPRKTSCCRPLFGKSTSKVVARLTTAFVLKLMSRYGKPPRTGPPVWLALLGTLRRSLDLMASSGIRHLGGFDFRKSLEWVLRCFLDSFLFDSNTSVCVFEFPSFFLLVTK